MKFFFFQYKWGVSFIDIYKSVNNVNAKYFLREFLDIFPFTSDYIVSIVHLHIKTSSGSYSKSINLICDDIFILPVYVGSEPASRYLGRK